MGRVGSEQSGENTVLSAGIRLGIIGDYRSGLASHAATDHALQHAANGVDLGAEWVGTELIAAHGENVLRGYDAFLCAPGSPYRSFEGALRGLRFARETDRPLLATCGGFQHMAIEFACNVLGRSNATNPEYDLTGPSTFIRPVVCQPLGSRMEVHIDPSSHVCSMYGRVHTCETYRCSFEVNPEEQGVLNDAGLRIVGVDDQGHARIIELASHPFYVGTLFVPQMGSEPGRPHPLIRALVEAAQNRRTMARALVGPE